MDLSFEALLAGLVRKGMDDYRSRPMATDKQPTSIRLEPETRQFLELQAAALNTSFQTVIHMLLTGVKEATLKADTDGHSERQSGRRAEMSERLTRLLSAVNETRRGSSLQPSHVAEGIGESFVEPVEEWFIGRREPSLEQLDAVARFLGGNAEWLRHGDKQPFPTMAQRLPEDPHSCVEWFLGEDGMKVAKLHLVRSMSAEGELAVVKQDADWRCLTYSTPCRISEEIGAGGQAMLAALAVSLRLLAKSVASRSVTVRSYLVGQDEYRKLTDGQIHPLTVLDLAEEVPWWEDLWDQNQFIPERDRMYWPGWRSLCELIASLVEENSFLRVGKKTPSETTKAGPKLLGAP